MRLLILLVISLCHSCFGSFSSVIAQEPKTPADLRKLADDYYTWRNQNYPGRVE